MYHGIKNYMGKESALCLATGYLRSQAKHVIKNVVLKHPVRALLEIQRNEHHDLAKNFTLKT